MVEHDKRFTKEKEVFICHTNEDIAFVERLVGELERRGVKCWYYERDNCGRHIGSAVGEALQRCDCLLFVMTKNIRKASEYIQNELNYYVENRRLIIPLRVAMEARWRPDGTAPLIGAIPIIDVGNGQISDVALKDICKRVLSAPHEDEATFNAQETSKYIVSGSKTPHVVSNRRDGSERHCTFKWVKWSAVALSATLIGLLVWDANRPVANYYADYVDSFGLPEGIFPLKGSELQGRFMHYRFEYRGIHSAKSPHADSSDRCVWNLFGFRRRLVRVVQVNSCGYPCKFSRTGYADRPQIQDFLYDDALRLREIRYGRYNGEGREPCLEKRIELFNERGVVNGLMQFFSREGQLDVAYGDTSTTRFCGSSSKSEIAMHLLRRNGKGRVTQRLFLNLSRTNISDGDGLYGFAYEYDDLGRQTAQWYLCHNGDDFERRANKKGIAGRRYEYYGRNIRKAEYVDIDGRPVLGPHGWMVFEAHYDEFDNNTETCFFDEKWESAYCEDGYVGYKAEYDWRGNKTRVSYYGVDGKLTLCKDGYAEMLVEYDERGNETKQSFGDIDGKPILHKDGYSEMRMKYDERGNKTRISFFDVYGKPTLNKDGFADVIAEYGVDGKVSKVTFLDERGKVIKTEEKRDE